MNHRTNPRAFAPLAASLFFLACGDHSAADASIPDTASCCPTDVGVQPNDASSEFDAADVVTTESGVDASTDSTNPCATPGIRFERRVLDTAYRNEGVGTFDVNGDGRPDIVTDQFWYDARDLSAHEIRTPVEWDRATRYAVGFGAYPIDVNHDGCNDVIATPHVNDEFDWYENPCGRDVGPSGHWTQHLVAPPGVAGLETPFATSELFGDHRPVVLSTDSRIGTLGWYEAPADPNGEWNLHAISNPNFPGGAAYQHGIGVGDVNGDGLADVLTGYGWFQQTADTTAPWPLHPVTFGPDSASACSRMWTYDVDADGLADIFCSRPHDAGLYWFRQSRASSDAEPTFTGQLIDDSVTSMHALRLADLDGDGTPEIISGTRWCAHCGAGMYPDPATAYLVYYAIRRSGSEVGFERHVIDCDTGVGVAFDIADVDGDGRLDIAIANKHGLFFFRQVP